jgi:hypothetical protein
LEDILLYATEKNIAVNFVAEKNYSKSSVLGRIAKITGGKVFYVGSVSVESKILKHLEHGRSDKLQLIYKDDSLWDASHVLEVLYKNNEEIDKVTSTVNYSGYWKRSLRFPFMFTIVLFFLILVLFIILVFLAKKKKNRDADKIGNNDLETQISSYTGDDHIDSSPNVIHDQNSQFLRGWLIQREGGESGKKFPLYWKEFNIGSHPRNGIVVNDPGISSSHARIRFAKESFYLLDLASDSGTFLNGRKVLRPKKLNDWDEIRIGSTTFIFRGMHNRV